MTVKEALLAKTIVKRPSWYINRHIMFFLKSTEQTHSKKRSYSLCLYLQLMKGRLLPEIAILLDLDIVFQSKDMRLQKSHID